MQNQACISMSDSTVDNYECSELRILDVNLNGTSFIFHSHPCASVGAP